MSLPTFAPDRTIRFDYDPVVHKIAFPINHVGAHLPDAIAEAEYAHTDDNTVYVSATSGSDTAGDGTQANPYATLLKGINETTEDLSRVVVLDSSLYSEDLSGADYTYFQGFYAAVGETPTYDSRVLGFTPTDADTIFVAKTGSDITGTGTQAAPVLTIEKAITLCDGTHQRVGIMDSGVYVEKAFTFAANFLMLFALAGCCPEVEVYPEDQNINYDSLVGATQYRSTATFGMKPCRLSSGKIIVVYHDAFSPQDAYFVVYNSDYTVYQYATQLNTNTTQYYAVKEMADGRIIIVYQDYSDGQKGKYIVLNPDFSVSVSATVFNNANASFCAVTILEDGKILILFQGQSAGYYLQYVLLNSDLTVITSTTTLVAAETQFIDAITLPDGRIFIVFMDGDASDYGKYLVLDSALNIVVSETAFHAGATGNIGTTLMANGQIFIVYRKVSNDKGYYIILNDDFSVFQSELLLVDTTIFEISVESTDSGDLFFTYVYWVRPSTATPYYFIWRPDNWCISNSVAIEINGIIFSCSSAYYLKRYVKASAEITSEYCTFKNLISLTGNHECWAVLSDSGLSIYNSIFRDGGQGIYTESANVLVQVSHFYRNAGGYALHVKGAGAGIGVQHCDFFNNYGSVRLESNDGNEVIKNNILHDNSNGALLDTEVVHSNSVNTDSNTNLTDGASVISTNPLYKNEGAVNPDDTDLNIRTRVEGYPTDSPAYGLADDDLNAGAYDVRYIGTETTWSSITVPKPPEIKPYLTAVGNVFHAKSVQSTKVAQNLVVPMKWFGIMNDDLEDLLDLWCCDSAEVRVYANPETAPDDFETYQLKYNKDISLATAYYPTQASGRQDIELEFERAYER